MMMVILNSEILTLDELGGSAAVVDGQEVTLRGKNQP